MDLGKHPDMMTPQQKQAQSGNQWNVVQTATGRFSTTPTRQHLGHAHRARMKDQSVSRTNANQARSYSSQAQWPRKCFVQNNTLTFSTSHVFSCTTHRSCLLRCHFLGMVVKREFRIWMEPSLPLVRRKSRSLSHHTCSDSSSISQLTEQLHSQHFPLHLHCYHVFE